MGYETKLIIGKAFEPERDERGEIVGTGHMEQYFMVMAEIGLCKTSHDGPLHALHKESIKRAKELAANHVVYFFGTGGDNRIKQDRYGDPFAPVHVEVVLEAIRAELKIDPDYRRFRWAVSLLQSMVTDPEELEVIFYGH